MTRSLTVFLPVDPAAAPELVDALRGDPHRWLPGASADGPTRWRIDIGLGRFHREVVCRVGRVRASEQVVRRRLDWCPSGHDGDGRSVDDLLPRFTGELMMHPGHQVLVLDGDYEVPGGRLGELADLAGLGALARRTGSALLADIVRCVR